jgi:hypothetical protein
MVDADGTVGVTPGMETVARKDGDAGTPLAETGEVVPPVESDEDAPPESLDVSELVLDVLEVLSLLADVLESLDVSDAFKLFVVPLVVVAALAKM